MIGLTASSKLKRLSICMAYTDDEFKDVPHESVSTHVSKEGNANNETMCSMRMASMK